MDEHLPVHERPQVSIIVVSYNTREILRQCLTSLFVHLGDVRAEVLVVDNDSWDHSAEMVAAEFPQVRLIANRRNMGFAAANNQAYARCRGEYVLLLNPDAFIEPGAVAAAVTFMDEHPQCGICGGRLVDLDGNPNPSARRFPGALAKLFTLSGLSARFPQSRLFNAHEFSGTDHDHPMEVDWVPGTFTLIRRSMLEAIGFFDDRFYIYYEETDLCLRAKRAGWSVQYVPDACVVHVGGASSQTRKDKEYDEAGAQILSFRMRSEWLYYRKNSGLLAVVANAGVEMGWHGLRYLINGLPGRTNGRDKQKGSGLIVREVWKSLMDTRFGGVSPERPW